MNRVKIIAEAGVNHNGSLALAKEMVDEAVKAQVDYIKFQTFIPDRLVSIYAKKADYQKGACSKGDSQLEMLKRLALTFEDFVMLQDYCAEQKIGFISTPFDLESMKFLEQLNMDFWKLPSGEMTNKPYLVALAKTGRPVVMSTGMCTLEEVKQAIAVFEKYGVSDITILQCNTGYPTPYEDVNLKAMNTMAVELGFPVGYSDHTQGIAMSIAAVARGAKIIEKHFTLDRGMEGPDHQASLEPTELRELVNSIRQVELGLGTGLKEPSKSELVNMRAARKSIVALRKIRVGEYFSEENLTVKRPGDGLSPMLWDAIVGQVAERNYEPDEQIKL